MALERHAKSVATTPSIISTNFYSMSFAFFASLRENVKQWQWAAAVAVLKFKILMSIANLAF